MKLLVVAALAAVLAAAPLAAAGSDVVTLDAASFDEQVARSDQPWLVKFYAPWCGHCKRLAPTWEELATATKGTARVAKVDCTLEQELCSRHGVRGYPTLRLFLDGPAGESEKYAGARSLDALRAFLDKAAAKLVPPEIRVRYFQTRGRAEVLRLALESMGLPYENALHASEEWPAIKKAGLADGSLPYGQVPALDYNGRTLVQTGAILRFLAAKHRPQAYPADPEQRYRVDLVMDGAEDLRRRYSKLVYDPDFSDQKRAAFAAETLPEWLGHLERLLRDNKEGASQRFVGAAGWTLADLAVFDVLTAALGTDPAALRAFPALATFHAHHVERLAPYLGSPRRPPFQNGAKAYFDNAANPSAYHLPVGGASAHDDL